MISGITENENNKEKERKHWIPNQVGDDKLLDPLIIDFEDDNGRTFEDDISVVISHTLSLVR